MEEPWSEPAWPGTPGISLATPFEEWCQAHAIHPDAYGAWEWFEMTLAAPTLERLTGT